MPSSSTPIRRHVARLVLVAFLATLPGSPLFAEVAGENVVAGDAAIERNGDITTIHASDGAIIEFDRFNVWSNEELHFIQPHDQARVLNRVLGDITHIDGGLFANGIVYIVNPAGIFFGSEAVVDVGGLYAAGGDIANEDFLAGTDQFELSANVENEGRIEAFSVALLGMAVANHGAIHAPDGTIALVAGERVLLTRLGGHLHVEVEGGLDGDADSDDFAIQQTGTVDAGEGSVSFTTGDVYSLALNHEGITRGADIDVRAASGLVQVAGVLDASDASAGGTGGDIAVTGEQVALLGASLDASGDAGGGAIRVGGDLRGAGALPNAKRTFVDADTVLRANALRVGDGGTVIVYADEATAFHGALSARGGDAGGDGGFAEISGAVFLFTDGDVDLRAARGETGTLLYDPQDIVLRGGSADGDDATDASATDFVHDPNEPGTLLFTDADMLAAPFEIFESEIEGTNANVVLEATNSIVADAAASFTNDGGGEGVGVLRIADGNSLTLRTRNDPGDEVGGAAASGIDLNTLALQTSGGGGVTLETGTGTEAGNLGGSIAVGNVTTGGANAAVEDAAGDVRILAGGVGSVTTGAIATAGLDNASGAGENGGDVTVSTEDGAITVASVDTSGGDTTSPDAMHAAGNAGSITISANDADSSADSDVDVAGDLVARGGSAAGGMGDGGRGGVVSVRSDGAEEIALGPETPDIKITQGGGALTLAGIDTIGGQGGAAGSGGAGGNVTVLTDDGAITIADVTTSGGSGALNGGNAGFLDSSTRDADQSAETLDDNDLVVGNFVARGGNGTSGNGGLGGDFRIQTARSALVRELGNPDNVMQEALGGGDVAIASIDARGGNGGTSGGSAFGGELVARGTGREVRIAGTVNASGGQGGLDPSQPDGVGGFGGVLVFGTDDGSILVTSIDASGGTTSSVDPADEAVGGNGGNGGRIDLVAGDFDASGDSDIQAMGDLVADGGSSADGTGGAGGQIEVRTEGVATPLPPDAAFPDQDPNFDPILGGGAIDLAAVLARGGAGREGGAGGRVDMGLAPNDGNLARIGDSPITVTGDIDVSGGAGDLAGGSAGIISVQSRDWDAADDNDISLANVRAMGGQGVNGGGGQGGTILIRSFPRLRITDTNPPDSGRVILDDSGGGDVRASTIDASGGDGATFGGDARIPPGNAATVDLLASGSSQTVDVTGVIRAAGGTGSDGNGGNGGLVRVRHRAADMIVDYQIDASGGSGTNVDATAPGGFGGLVTLQTGLEAADPAADIIVQVLPNTRRGDGGAASAPRPSGSLNLFSSGVADFGAGPVALIGNTFVTADGGVVVNGTLDTEAGADSELAFLATVGGGSSIFAGDIGANRALSSVAVVAAEDAVDPTLAFEGASVTTTGLQRFEPNATVATDTAFSAGGSLGFLGDLDAAPAAASSNVTMNAALVGFGGDVGGTTPLNGLEVDAGTISFTDVGGARVLTDGPTGIRFNADTVLMAPPTMATIGALGDLRLESTAGDVIIGDLQKVSAGGRLELVGDTVRFTDLSGLDISVEATTAQLYARDVGLVQYPSGLVVTDGGTDIVGNTVSFSTAPTVVGNGPAPRIATLSGTAANAGVVRVATLQAPITYDQIVTPELDVLDLAIPAPDPGNETPELEGPVEVPAALYSSEEEAGSGAPVSSAEVVAWLSCAPEGGAARAGCTPPAKPAYGSALDTERAAEVARSWRRLLGDSQEAKAGRASLALAARDPNAALGGRATSPAGRSYLQDTARLLGRTRLLGLDAATYAEVQGELIAGIVARIGEPNLDAERLLAAIEPYAMGMLASH